MLYSQFDVIPFDFLNLFLDIDSDPWLRSTYDLALGLGDIYTHAVLVGSIWRFSYRPDASKVIARILSGGDDPVGKTLRTWARNLSDQVVRDFTQCILCEMDMLEWDVHRVWEVESQDLKEHTLQGLCERRSMLDCAMSVFVLRGDKQLAQSLTSALTEIDAGAKALFDHHGVTVRASEQLIRTREPGRKVWWNRS